MKRKSILNNTYGKLTVIEEIYGEKSKSGKPKTYCRCSCECGNEVIRSRDTLLARKTPSCGCARAEINRKVRGKEVVGNKYGKLTVVENIWAEPRTKLRCICECGKEYIGIKTQILSGKTKSCGCLKREASNKRNWSGYVSEFGVKIISESHQEKDGLWIWNCQCGLCGKMFEARPSKVSYGHITSCGCRATSAREELIDKYLSELDITYKKQFSFDDCLDKRKLRFDFAVFDNNEELSCLIEYDGGQHFSPMGYNNGKESYEATLRRDKIKNTYCQNNNIPLLRLPCKLRNDEIRIRINEFISFCMAA